MEQFKQFTNGNGLFIGVDFGHGNDFAVETQIQKQSDGSLRILSCNIIGRSKNLTEERKQQICKGYERLCDNEAVD